MHVISNVNATHPTCVSQGRLSAEPRTRFRFLLKCKHTCILLDRARRRGSATHNGIFDCSFFCYVSPCQKRSLMHFIYPPSRINCIIDNSLHGKVFVFFSILCDSVYTADYLPSYLHREREKLYYEFSSYLSYLNNPVFNARWSEPGSPTND